MNPTLEKLAAVVRAHVNQAKTYAQAGHTEDAQAYSNKAHTVCDAVLSAMTGDPSFIPGEWRERCGL